MSDFPDKTLYWSSIEVELIDGNEWYGEIEGGYVYIFLPALDARDALTQIESAVPEERLKIRLIEFISPYDGIEWETEEEQEMYDELAKKAQLLGDVVFDDVYAYEDEDAFGNGDLN